MKSIALHNLGCKVNEYEIEIMQQNIQKAGWEIVDFAQKADIYIINTCSVTNIADRKSRQMLHRARKMNPDAIVVAVGCYAQTDTKGALSDDAIDIVIGNNRKTEIVEIIEGFIADRDKKCFVDDLSISADFEESSLDKAMQRCRVDIKIQDGCNQFCSYCIIPYARGRVRSRKPDSILKEVSRLAGEGVKEVVLTGIHLSSYGLDFHGDENGKGPSYNSMAANGDFTNYDLIKVLKDVSDVEGISRIRMGSLEPRVITDEFLGAISKMDKVCPHFHLSLQSGCDDTLKRMNRRYSAEEYKGRVELIREYYDNPAITTDIIVGFPGETEDEFEETCRFVDSINFYETHIFKYSKRKGTVAEKMPNQLTEAVKAERSDVLLKKNDANARSFREKMIGMEQEILTEDTLQIDGKTYTVGYTINYVRCAIEGTVAINSIVSGQAQGLLTDDILLLK